MNPYRTSILDILERRYKGKELHPVITVLPEDEDEDFQLLSLEKQIAETRSILKLTFRTLKMNPETGNIYHTDYPTEIDLTYWRTLLWL